MAKRSVYLDDLLARRISVATTIDSGIAELEKGQDILLDYCTAAEVVVYIMHNYLAQKRAFDKPYMAVPLD